MSSAKVWDGPQAAKDSKEFFLLRVRLGGFMAGHSSDSTKHCGCVNANGVIVTVPRKAVRRKLVLVSEPEAWLRARQVTAQGVR